MKKAKLKILRAVSILTVIAFTVTSLELQPLAHAIQSVPQLVSGEVAVRSGFELSLPPELCVVQNLVSGNRGAVVHLQAAHGNYDAQKKIENILHYLKEQYDIDLLFVEGSAFKLRPEKIRFFPDRMDITMEVLEGLARKALIKGSELFLAKTDAVQAYGIEDIETYKADAEAFRYVMKQQEAVEDFLDAFKNDLKTAKSKNLNPVLRNFLRESERYLQNTTLLHERLNWLEAQAKEQLEIDFSKIIHQMDWPMLVRYFALKAVEGKLDFAAFEKERDVFLTMLTGNRAKALPPSAARRIRELLTGPVSENQLPDPETGLLFEQMAEVLPLNFDYDAYPNVKLFIGHLILQSEIKAGLLYSEANRIENQILKKLIRTDAEREVVEKIKRLNQIEKLLHLELMPEEWEELASQTVAGDIPENMQNIYKHALEFYRLAKQRDELMLKNIKTRLAESGKDKAVVITGGFHSQAFFEHFRQAGYSYALISPEIKDLGGREAYVASMLQGQSDEAISVESQADSERPIAERLPLNSNLESLFLALSRQELEKSGGNTRWLFQQIRNEIRSVLRRHGIHAAEQLGASGIGVTESALHTELRNAPNRLPLEPSQIIELLEDAEQQLAQVIIDETEGIKRIVRNDQNYRLSALFQRGKQMAALSITVSAVDKKIQIHGRTDIPVDPKEFKVLAFDDSGNLVKGVEVIGGAFDLKTEIDLSGDWNEERKQALDAVRFIRIRLLQHLYPEAAQSQAHASNDDFSWVDFPVPSADQLRAFYEEHGDDGAKPLSSGGYIPVGMVQLSPRILNWYEQLINDFGRKMKILSLGSGRGQLEKALQDAGHRVTAVDISPKNARLAQVPTVVGDVHLPLDLDHDYDLVIIADSIGQLDPEQVFRQASRYLREGGHLFVSTPRTKTPMTLKEYQDALYIRYPAFYLNFKLEHSGFEVVSQGLIPIDGDPRGFTLEYHTAQLKTRAELRSQGNTTPFVKAAVPQDLTGPDPQSAGLAAAAAALQALWKEVKHKTAYFLDAVRIHEAARLVFRRSEVRVKKTVFFTTASLLNYFSVSSVLMLFVHALFPELHYSALSIAGIVAGLTAASPLLMNMAWSLTDRLTFIREDWAQKRAVKFYDQLAAKAHTVKDSEMTAGIKRLNPQDPLRFMFNHVLVMTMNFGNVIGYYREQILFRFLFNFTAVRQILEVSYREQYRELQQKIQNSYLNYLLAKFETPFFQFYVSYQRAIRSFRYGYWMLLPVIYAEFNIHVLILISALFKVARPETAYVKPSWFSVLNDNFKALWFLIRTLIFKEHPDSVYETFPVYSRSIVDDVLDTPYEINRRDRPYLMRFILDLMTRAASEAVPPLFGLTENESRRWQQIYIKRNDERRAFLMIAKSPRFRSLLRQFMYGEQLILESSGILNPEKLIITLGRETADQIYIEMAKRRHEHEKSFEEITQRKLAFRNKFKFWKKDVLWAGGLVMLFPAVLYAVSRFTPLLDAYFYNLILPATVLSGGLLAFEMVYELVENQSKEELNERSESYVGHQKRNLHTGDLVRYVPAGQGVEESVLAQILAFDVDRATVSLKYIQNEKLIYKPKVNLRFIQTIPASPQHVFFYERPKFSGENKHSGEMDEETQTRFTEELLRLIRDGAGGDHFALERRSHFVRFILAQYFQMLTDRYGDEMLGTLDDLMKSSFKEKYYAVFISDHEYGRYLPYLAKDLYTKGYIDREGQWNWPLLYTEFGYEAASNIRIDLENNRENSITQAYLEQIAAVERNFQDRRFRTGLIFLGVLCAAAALIFFSGLPKMIAAITFADAMVAAFETAFFMTGFAEWFAHLSLKGNKPYNELRLRADEILSQLNPGDEVAYYDDGLVRQKDGWQLELKPPVMAEILSINRKARTVRLRFYRVQKTDQGNEGGRYAADAVEEVDDVFAVRIKKIAPISERLNNQSAAGVPRRAELRSAAGSAEDKTSSAVTGTQLEEAAWRVINYFGSGYDIGRIFEQGIVELEQVLTKAELRTDSKSAPHFNPLNAGTIDIYEARMTALKTKSKKHMLIMGAAAVSLAVLAIFSWQVAALIAVPYFLFDAARIWVFKYTDLRWPFMGLLVRVIPSYEMQFSNLQRLYADPVYYWNHRSVRRRAERIADVASKRFKDEVKVVKTTAHRHSFGEDAADVLKLVAGRAGEIRAGKEFDEHVRTRFKRVYADNDSEVFMLTQDGRLYLMQKLENGAEDAPAVTQAVFEAKSLDIVSVPVKLSGRLIRKTVQKNKVQVEESVTVIDGVPYAFYKIENLPDWFFNAEISPEQKRTMLVRSPAVEEAESAAVVEPSSTEAETPVAIEPLDSGPAVVDSAVVEPVSFDAAGVQEPAIASLSDTAADSHEQKALQPVDDSADGSSGIEPQTFIAEPVVSVDHELSAADASADEYTQPSPLDPERLAVELESVSADTRDQTLQLIKDHAAYAVGLSSESAGSQELKDGLAHLSHAVHLSLKLLEIAAQDKDTRDLLYITGQFQPMVNALEQTFEIRSRYRVLVPDAEELDLGENPLILMTAILWEDEFLKYLPEFQAVKIMGAAARMAAEEQYAEYDLAESLWLAALKLLGDSWVQDLTLERSMHKGIETAQKEKSKTAKAKPDPENPALKKQLSDFYTGVGQLRSRKPDDEAVIKVALQIFEAMQDWPDEHYKRKDVQGAAIAMSQLAGIMRKHDLYDHAVELLKFYVSKTADQPNAFILFHLGGIYRRAANLAWEADQQENNHYYLNQALSYFSQGLPYAVVDENIEKTLDGLANHVIPTLLKVAREGQIEWKALNPVLREFVLAVRQLMQRHDWIAEGNGELLALALNKITRDWIAQNLYRAAQLASELSLMLDPVNPHTLFNLAAIAVAQGRIEDADRYREEIETLNRTSLASPFSLQPLDRIIREGKIEEDHTESVFPPAKTVVLSAKRRRVLETKLQNNESQSVPSGSAEETKEPAVDWEAVAGIVEDMDTFHRNVRLGHLTGDIIAEEQERIQNRITQFDFHGVEQFYEALYLDSSDEASIQAAVQKLKQLVEAKKSELRTAASEKSENKEWYFIKQTVTAAYHGLFLWRPAGFKYKPGFFEASKINPKEKNQKVRQLFDAMFAYVEKRTQERTPQKKSIAARMQVFRETSAVVSIEEYPLYFLRPGDNTRLPEATRVSVRRHAIHIPRKLIDALNPESELDLAILAYYLNRAQYQIDLYHENAEAQKHMSAAHRKMIRARVRPDYKDRQFFFGQFDPELVKKRFDELESLDRELLSKDMPLSQAAEQEGALAFANLVDQRFFTVPAGGRIPFDQNLLALILTTARSFERLGIWHDLKGDHVKAEQLYARAVKLYTYAPRVDPTGWGPALIQEEMVFTLLRHGRMKEFVQQLKKLFNAEYTAKVFQKRQMEFAEPYLLEWAVNALPDMLYKLHFYLAVFNRPDELASVRNAIAEVRRQYQEVLFELDARKRHGRRVGADAGKFVTRQGAPRKLYGAKITQLVPPGSLMARRIAQIQAKLKRRLPGLFIFPESSEMPVVNIIPVQQRPLAVARLERAESRFEGPAAVFPGKISAEPVASVSGPEFIGLRMQISDDETFQQWRRSVNDLPQRKNFHIPIAWPKRKLKVEEARIVSDVLSGYAMANMGALKLNNPSLVYFEDIMLNKHRVLRGIPVAKEKSELRFQIAAAQAVTPRLVRFIQNGPRLGIIPLRFLEGAAGIAGFMRASGELIFGSSAYADIVRANPLSLSELKPAAQPGREIRKTVSEERKAQARAALGIKQEGDAYVLGSGFALEYGALAAWREIFGEKPVVVIVRSSSERRRIEDYNESDLAARGHQPVLIAENIFQAGRQIEKAVTQTDESLRVQGFFAAEDLDLAAEAEALKKQLADFSVYIRSQSEFQRFVRAAHLEETIRSFLSQKQVSVAA